MTPAGAAPARARSDRGVAARRRPPRELPATTPELAVAQGAAYYGLVRRGLGARIGRHAARVLRRRRHRAERRRGDARGVPGAQGLEEAARVELARDFELVTNRPVSFRLYSSSTRDDQPGRAGADRRRPAGDHRRRQRPARAAADRDGAARARPRRGHRAPRGPHHRARRARDLLPRSRAPQGARPARPRWKLAFDMRVGRRRRARPPTEGAAAPAIRSRRRRARWSRAAFRGGAGALAPDWSRRSRSCSRRAATSGRC